MALHVLYIYLFLYLYLLRGAPFKLRDYTYLVTYWLQNILLTLGFVFLLIIISIYGLICFTNFQLKYINIIH